MRSSGRTLGIGPAPFPPSTDERRLVPTPIGVSRVVISGTEPRSRAMHDAARDDEREDRELVARIRTGDVAAFERLMERYWARVCLYVEHFDGADDLAADVGQEVFARLWKARHDWDPAGSVAAWLMCTARNLVISEQRKRKVRTRWALFAPRADARRPVTPLQATEQAELRSALERAIQSLPSRRREAITLYHLQGLSYREIGEIMGIRPQTAANYLQAAFADLRGMLAGFFPALQEGDESGDATGGDGAAG